MGPMEKQTKICCLHVVILALAIWAESNHVCISEYIEIIVFFPNFLVCCDEKLFLNLIDKILYI